MGMTEADSSDTSAPKSAQEWQQYFRASGWNVAGSNVLSLSCIISRAEFLYVRPQIGVRDILAVTIPAAVIGSLLYSLFGWYISALTCICASGFYLLFKAGSWRPAETLLADVAR